MGRPGRSAWVSESATNRHGGRLAKEYLAVANHVGTGNLHRAQEAYNPFPPWDPDPRITINTHLPTTKKTCPEANRAASEAALEALPEADVEVWTDGSVCAAGATRHNNAPGIDFLGGSGVVLVFKNSSLAASLRAT